MERRVGAVQAAAMLLAGILVGQKTHPSLLPCILLFGICLGGSIFFYFRGRQYKLDQPPKKASRALLCAALFAFGLGRTALMSHGTRADAVENFTDREYVSFTGHVIAPPVTSSTRTTLRVQVDGRPDETDQPGSGRLLLVFFRKPETEYHYGDRLQISGKVILPPDSGSGFSYRTYLERENIKAMINNPHAEILPGFTGSRILARIYRLRSALLDRVYRLFPKPESALMAGILLGDESGIPSDVEHDFQRTGTSHIIAISGMNFTVLTMLLLGILRRLIRQWWAPLLMLPVIVFYTILVGGNPTVVRAAIMCWLSIFGSVFGRNGNGINNLALASALMALVRPAVLFDLGFQLSVTATLGILLFAEPVGNRVRWLIARIFPKISETALTAAVNALNDLCILTLCAQVFTIWITAQASGRISLISPIANFLIAPFQTLIMVGGFTALILSFLFYPFGAAAAWLVYSAPALTIRIVRLCAKAGWASVWFDLPPLQAWLIIGLILSLYLGRTVLIDSVRRRNFMPYAVLLSAFAAVMIWVNVLDRWDQRTKIEIAQTNTSLTLSVLTPADRLFVIGEGLTNYAAQELLEKKILPVKRVPSAAWIDLREEWMRQAFLESGAGEDLPVFYLNGSSLRKDAGLPEALTAGSVLTADGISVRMAGSFLGKRAWIIADEPQLLLVPNGIPPQRIFTRENPHLREISLIVLGRRDDPAVWKAYCEEKGAYPYLLDGRDEPSVTLILSGGKISLRSSR